MTFRAVSAVLVALCLPATIAAGHTPPKPAAVSSPAPTLVASPKSVVLTSPYETVRPLFDLGHSSPPKDVTTRVTMTAQPAGIVALAGGSVRGVKDGNAVVTATVRSGETTVTTRIPVQVTGMKNPAAPRFVADVMPVLTKTGCNGGPCHGANAGKGGFRLSLLGYDPDGDFESLVKLAGARRVSPSDPENSLLLRKATGRMKHGGGRRIAPDSVEYALLRDWIARGAPAPDPKDPVVVRLEAVPSGRTLGKGASQRLRVQATFSDLSTRDVTDQTLFSSADQALLMVSKDGTAEVVAPGEGVAVIRYRFAVTTARVLSPFAPPVKAALPRDAGSIDRLVFGKIAELGLVPSTLADDGEFMRRAFLDVIGVPPTPDEARAFLADRSPEKRDRLIDALLQRPEYVDFWTTRWGDMLRSSRRALSDRGMTAFHSWIRQSVAENKPWDRFVREILLATGDSYENGPAGFFRISASPEDLGETAAQLFLGVRLQCARCHNHPYEKWTQTQFHELAAFFGRVRARARYAVDEADVSMVSLARGGNTYFERMRRVVAPAALDAPSLPEDYPGDRREALADWITAPENPFFARVMANRLWRHFMGRGLVEPVDDLRVTNPPTNEPLLDHLAKELRTGGYDLKRLMRSILRSRAYQLSSRRLPGNEADSRYYSRYLVKRLTAEQLLDSLMGITGVPEKFAGYPLGTRAAQLPDTMVLSYFLDAFGRPARQTTCECERSNEPTIGQALHLLNGASLNEKLAAPQGRLAKLLASGQPPEKMAEELYLAAFTRYPTAAERARAVKLLSTPKKPEERQRAAEDLLWALLNTKEFIFNR